MAEKLHLFPIDLKQEDKATYPASLLMMSVLIGFQLLLAVYRVLPVRNYRPVMAIKA